MVTKEQGATGNSVMKLVTGTDWRRGLNNLLRGELKHWFGTRTWWVQILIWTLSVNLIYLMVSLSARGEADFESIMIFNIFLGLAGPIGTCIVMQMAVVGETRAGTAAWILSKPVSRPAFILSKLIGNAIGLAVTLVLAQGVIAYLITAVVLGDFLPVAGFLAGLGVHMANILFYMTMTLMFGAIFDHPAPVIGIPMAFLFVQQFLVSLAPGLANILPWSLIFPLNNSTELPMSSALMLGEPVSSYLALYGTLAFSVLFVVIALWVFQRQEL
jgi:ABC-2 type transport system permease protein